MKAATPPHVRLILLASGEGQTTDEDAAAYFHETRYGIEYSPLAEV
jgi:hypothetical protein